MTVSAEGYVPSVEIDRRIAEFLGWSDFKPRLRRSGGFLGKNPRNPPGRPCRRECVPEYCGALGLIVRTIDEERGEISTTWETRASLYQFPSVRVSVPGDIERYWAVVYRQNDERGYRLPLAEALARAFCRALSVRAGLSEGGSDANS